MKKLLLTTSILLLAAACNNNQQAQVQPVQNQATSTSQALQAQPQATSTNESKANWKTYSNEVYGFEFQYPIDWTFQHQTGTPVGEEDTLSKGNSVFIVHPNGDDTSPNANDEKVMVAGKQAYKEQDQFGGTNYYFCTNPNNLSAPCLTVTLNSGNSSDTQILEEVFSTFKFTSQTSGWKTYSNTKYNFSFIYPPDWTVNDQSYSYQGQDYVKVEVASPLISGVPGASRDAFFYLDISRNGQTWSRGAYGINLSLLKSDGGPVSVNVSDEYLESIPQYQTSQVIYQSIKNSN